MNVMDNNGWLIKESGQPSEVETQPGRRRSLLKLHTILRMTPAHDHQSNGFQQELNWINSFSSGLKATGVKVLVCARRSVYVCQCVF